MYSTRSLFLSYFNDSNFLKKFSKNPKITNFMKIHPMRSSFSMRTDGLIDRYDETNSRFKNSTYAANKIIIMSKVSCYERKNFYLPADWEKWNQDAAEEVETKWGRHQNISFLWIVTNKSFVNKPEAYN
jgi:hypothetical protein